MYQTILWPGQGILHEQVSVSIDRREALSILMQHEIELMYTFEAIAFNSFVWYFLLPSDRDFEIWYWSGSKFTLPSKKTWNKPQ